MAAAIGNGKIAPHQQHYTRFHSNRGDFQGTNSTRIIINKRNSTLQRVTGH